MMLRFRDIFFAAKPSFAQSYRNRGEAAENFYGQNWSQLRTQVENRAEAVETTFFLVSTGVETKGPNISPCLNFCSMEFFFPFTRIFRHTFRKIPYNFCLCCVVFPE